jgi:hypothetical protein
MMEVKKNWKSRTWYKMAVNEFGKYKKTKNPEKLAEAGEKLYNALTLLLDERTGKKLKNFRLIKKEAMIDPLLKNIFEDAYWLHVFFYRGFTEDITTEEEKFRNVSKKLKEVI